MSTTPFSHGRGRGGFGSRGGIPEEDIEEADPNLQLRPNPVFANPNQGNAQQDTVPQVQQALDSVGTNIFNTLLSRSRTAFARSAPFVLVPNYTSFLANNHYNDSDTSAVLFALSWALKRLAPQSFSSGLRHDAALVVWITYNTGNQTGTTWNGLAGNPGTLHAGVSAPRFVSIVSVVGSTELPESAPAVGWLVDLVAASQVRKLSDSNITNYFVSIGSPDIQGALISGLLVYASSVLPKIMSDPHLRGLLSDTKWLEYHTSYSSTGSLVMKMVNAYPNIVGALFSKENIDRARTSADFPFDIAANSRIPQQLILCTAAYQAAFEITIEEWKQGERAVSDLPAASYDLYLRIFKKVREITADYGGIASSTTMAELLKWISDNVKPET